MSLLAFDLFARIIAVAINGAPPLWMARPSTAAAARVAAFRRRIAMDISVLGIDLGKNSCSIVGLGLNGKVLVRRNMRRDCWL
jgi:hypothetical protein